MIQNKIVIGLTGGIGCGKSSVSAILKGLGAYIIDGDTISRGITETNINALKDIQRSFGASVFTQDGKINRKMLGDIVFGSKTKLEELNAIMFGYVKNAVREELEIAKLDKEVKYIVIDGAILFEMGLDKDCDIVCGISTGKESQIDRIMKRNGLTYDEALKRVHSQISTEELTKKCNYIIENSGIIEELKEKVLNFMEYVNNCYQ